MKNPEILYLDHAAAARPDPVILELYASLVRENFVNQEAGHPAAFALRQRLAAAARELAAAAGFPDYSVFFADCGTGIARLLPELPVPDGDIAASGFEHPAVAAALRRWNRPVRDFRPSDGQIAAVAVATAVQSELGAIADWAALPPARVVVADAVQAAGKLPLTAFPADALLISGRKFGAPGGAALLYHPRLGWEKRFHELRERDYLAVRPDPALCLTLSAAMVRHATDLELRLADMRCFQLELRRRLEPLPLRCTVPAAQASPYILHLLAPGKQGAVLVRMLGESGILAASGSACQAEAGGPSSALRALGLRRDDAYSGLRLSFMEPLSPEQTERLVTTLDEILRKY